jgi:phosphatidylglycerol:prolipoprotein diacylglycerol transferase
VQARQIAPTFGLKPIAIDDFITYAVAGIIVGGRLGYILFYDLAHHLEHPLQILQTWKGGMSFHGGFIGVVVAGVLHCRRQPISIPSFADTLAIVSPLGLFLGRIANFINAEHYGRPTDSAWGMIFPNSDGLPRHPSQLYEAALEGIVLWCVMLFVYRRFGSTIASKRPGFFIGLFIAGYGIARYAVEFMREPDALYTILTVTISIGQLLSIPMILAGIALIIWSRKVNARTR